jgi:PAS domain S-box-containing protein
MLIAATIKILTGIESILLGILTLYQRPKGLGNFLFAIYVFFVAVQAFIELHLIIAPDLTSFLLWKRADTFTFPAVGLMLHFALVYTNNALARDLRFLVPLYAIFLLMSVGSSTVAYPISGTTSPWGFKSVYSPIGKRLFLINVLLASAFAIVTLILFWNKYRRSRVQQERRQTGIMFSAMAGLIIVGVVTETVHPLFGFSFPWALSATSAFLVINPLLGYALIRYDVLAITPAAAADDILQMMSDGVLLLDPTGIIRFANRAAGGMIGRPASQLEGIHVDNLPIRCLSGDKERCSSDSFWARETMIDKEGAIDRPGHMQAFVSLSSSPLVRKGTSVGFVVTIRDISVRKQSEEYRSVVDKIMRHDLKNSLGAIMGLSEIMGLDSDLQTNHRKWVEAIYRSGEMMLRQIDSYLALEKIEQGTFELEINSMDLVVTLRDVTRALTGRIEDADITLALTLNGVELSERDQYIIVSQEALVYSMLTNLIKNAAEAAPRRSRVSVNITTGERISIAIVNQGTIPDDIKMRFFDKFVTHGKCNGTGLGTYSAKLIAETLGGSIELCTGTDATVTVVVTLPLAPQGYKATGSRMIKMG